MRSEIKKFGKRIREIRLKKKMSQGDVAEILGVHRTYISSMERGLRNPSLLTIKKFAQAFGIKTKDMLNF
ncbi:MAG: helix-turn-helix transcriptional regulator [bacterium]|nr:helix-turn-helix transcriptional regulator [bacterium]